MNKIRLSVSNGAAKISDTKYSREDIIHSDDDNELLLLYCTYISNRLNSRKLCESCPSWNDLRIKEGEICGYCESCTEHIASPRIALINNKLCDLFERLGCPTPFAGYLHCCEDYFMEWSDEENGQGRFNLDFHFKKSGEIEFWFMESHHDDTKIPTTFLELTIK